MEADGGKSGVVIRDSLSVFRGQDLSQTPGVYKVPPALGLGCETPGVSKAAYMAEWPNQE